jgi:hypothetical protein
MAAEQQQWLISRSVSSQFQAQSFTPRRFYGDQVSVLTESPADQLRKHQGLNWKYLSAFLRARASGV